MDKEVQIHGKLVEIDYVEPEVELNIFVRCSKCGHTVKTNRIKSIPLLSDTKLFCDNCYKELDSYTIIVCNLSKATCDYECSVRDFC